MSLKPLFDTPQYTTKTLITYVGNKTRTIPYLLPHFPEEMTELMSPFIGSAALELQIAAREIKVNGYDAQRELVWFYQGLLKDRDKVFEIVMNEYYPATRDHYFKALSRLRKSSPHMTCDSIKSQIYRYMQSNDVPELTNIYERAAAYFAASKLSYSGRALHGYSVKKDSDKDLQRKNTRAVYERIKDFYAPYLTVEHADFKESIPKHPNAWLYCDPPYVSNKDYYGWKKEMRIFDHEGLAELLNARNNWVLSYEDHELVRDLYGQHIFYSVPISYRIGNVKNKPSGEVFIICKDNDYLNMASKIRLPEPLWN